MKKRNFLQPRQLTIDIPKQSLNEIATYLHSINDEWNFTCSNDGLVFMEDGKPVLVIPLITIYRTSIIDRTLYILCNNGVLHCVGQRKHDHWVIFLDNMEEDIFSRMFN